MPQSYLLCTGNCNDVVLGWIARVATLQVGNDGHLPINVDSSHVDTPHIDALVIGGQARGIDIDRQCLSLALEVIPWHAHRPYWDKRTCVIAAAGEVRCSIFWRCRLDSGILEDRPTSAVAESGASFLYVCPEPVIVCSLVCVNDHIVALTCHFVRMYMLGYTSRSA